MEKVLLYIIAASGLCAVFSMPRRQYHFVYDMKNWTEAQSYCREKYTDLAIIESIEDAKTLKSMANLGKMAYTRYPSYENYRAWIGLYDDVNSWRWSMSDRDFYKDGEADFRNWLTGQPDNKKSSEHCAVMDGDGLWKDESCKNLFKVVCSDVRGPNVAFVFIEDEMNWTEAQSYCRAHYTDLASVRNMLENQKVKDTIPVGQQAWIGLFRDAWKWSGGSNSTFRYWAPGEPNNLSGEACAGAYFWSQGNWEDTTCYLRRAFACYEELPVFKQVVKLKLVKDSDLDLNDPAVMEDILKQFNQTLMDQGVKGGIQLSWRKQSDGDVFHKYEEETNATLKKDEL